MFRTLIIICFISIFTCSSFGQKGKENFLNVGITNLCFGYGVEFPFADLSDRFGRNLKFTLGAERITKSNWIFGLEFSYMFGDTVKEDVLAHLRLSNNEILGADNGYADSFTRERGVFVGANFGKLIPFKANSRSGLRITCAAGLLSHYVRVQDEAGSLPQIEGDYLKGYDRLTRGLALRQFVGYQHIAEDKRVNFYIGLEFTQGFTKSVRDVNFDTGLATNKSTRFDGLIGIKAAWILPFFDDFVDEEVFY
ncbi:MAG: hypothetical protein P1U56_10140 [Saprospiraceae bacterium]|nr:hypothetical protein [Saprospiraceae bacterium]